MSPQNTITRVNLDLVRRGLPAGTDVPANLDSAIRNLVAQERRRGYQVCPQ
ncbi:MAG: hypothetical protein AAF468_22680 [Pseudomonadota bacterium]